MMTHTKLLVSVFCLMSPVMVLADVQKMFHVAVDGDDKNPGTQDKPFATIERARQAVRSVNGDMTGDIEVILHGGVYVVDRTIVFDAGDSGTNRFDVIYKAADGATPTISGGRPVKGWTENGKGIWKAPAPIDNFRQLYVGGKRATRARGKVPAGLELMGDDAYKTTDVGMANWKNPDDLEFCYLNIWAHTRCKVQSIKREDERAIIIMLQPYFTHAKTKDGAQVSNAGQVQDIYIENALELLDEPGEWFLDHKAKTVYYMPRQGEDMKTTEVVAPAVEKLVELRGTLDQPVKHIRFEGVTFRHGGWLRPSKIGHCDVQANLIVDSDRKDSFNRPAFSNVHNENLKSPANVICHAAKAIVFDRCTFNQLGGAGLDIEFGSQSNVVSGCHFYDISGTAVQIGDVLKDDHHPDDPRMVVKSNAIENCYIHDCCVEYMGGVGVFVGYTEGTRISHNVIMRLPYSGISIGWGWGEEDAGGGASKQPFVYDTPTPAKDNRIEYNHIHHVMQRMGDGGGIYTLGNQPGTIIRGNYIHDNPGGAVYTDEGSGFIEITGNVSVGPQQLWQNNKNQNRIATCNVHDNFFGAKPDEAQPIVEKAGLEPEYRELLKGK